MELGLALKRRAPIERQNCQFHHSTLHTKFQQDSVDIARFRVATTSPIFDLWHARLVDGK